MAAIVRRVMNDPAYRVVLFGSWAAGHPRSRSDIDLGIDGPHRISPATMQDLRDACEALPTLYTIDLVDLATLPLSVRDDAMAHAVLVSTAP